MNKPTELKTGYKPEVIDSTGISLPIVLRNRQGEELATIAKLNDQKDKFVGYVNFNKIDNYGFAYDSVTECIEGVFGYLYQEMQDYRKQAEEYREVKAALKKALK